MIPRPTKNDSLTCTNYPFPYSTSVDERLEYKTEENGRVTVTSGGQFVAQFADKEIALKYFHRSQHFDMLEFSHKFQPYSIPSFPIIARDDFVHFRVGFMQEELAEFSQAAASKDIGGMADALVDLAYVAHGTAVHLGLPWHDLWNAVHNANMSKVRGDKNTSKRGSQYDVVKPKGWQPPDIEAIINHASIVRRHS